MSLDSRRLHAGEAFLALRGPRYDAHDFLPQALSLGATCLIVSRLPAPGALAKHAAALRNGHGCPSVSAILVDDTTLALGALASFHRMRFHGPVIAVTGSCGKTTTKELLGHVLSTQRRVLKTQGTQNNHIGLPLTLLRLSPEHTTAIVELGSNHPGEIAYLASIARPTVAIITNIGPAHLEFFGSMTGVFQEKLSLVEALGVGHTAIVPGDQLDVVIEATRRLPAGARLRTFGTSERCDLQALDIQRRDGAWTFRLRGILGEFTLPLPGSHNLENALAALAGAQVLGVPLESVREALRTFRTLSMRSEVLTCGTVTLLNDCYNANPLSFARSLEMFEELDSLRRIVIAGDMAELGRYAAGAHQAIGRMAAQRGVDVLIAVGAHASDVEQGAREAGCRRVETYREVGDLLRALPQLMRPGDAVLVKGSRRLKLEQVSEFVQEQFGTAPQAGASSTAGACPAR